MSLEVPLIVRLEGTNVDMGKSILKVIFCLQNLHQASAVFSNNADHVFLFGILSGKWNDYYCS